MALKAIVVDDENIQHLIIGLNRENVESLLEGEVFTLPPGPVPVLTENKSDIVILFAETDGDLARGFPPKAPASVTGATIGWWGIVYTA
jgi:hypothetical protein